MLIILETFPFLELCNAATKIQASFRGHLTRKHEAEKKHEPEGCAAHMPEKEVS